MRRVQKICFLGEESVGKTSLVQRFVHDRFSEEYKSTIGVSISKKSITNEDTVVDLMLWDLEGNREPESFPANYFRGAAGAIVVFDASRVETQEKAIRFAKAFLNQSPDAQCLLVANKIDLLTDFSTDSWDEEFRGMGLGFNDYFATSAKSGANVQSLFHHFLKEKV